MSTAGSSSLPLVCPEMQHKVAAVSQFSIPCKVPLLPWHEKHKRCLLPPWLVPLLMQGVDDGGVMDGDAGEVDEDGHGSADGAGGPGLASNPGLRR